MASWALSCCWYSLTTRRKSLKCGCLCVFDDTAIFADDSNSNFAVSRLQRQLDVYVEWADRGIALRCYFRDVRNVPANLASAGVQQIHLVTWRTHAQAILHHKLWTVVSIPSTTTRLGKIILNTYVLPTSLPCGVAVHKRSLQNVIDRGLKLADKVFLHPNKRTWCLFPERHLRQLARQVLCTCSPKHHHSPDCRTIFRSFRVR